MSLSVQGVSSALPVYRAQVSNPVKQLSFKANEVEAETDVVDIKAPVEEKKELSVEDKQKIIKSAKTKAAGWAMIGGIFSTAYYGLRSNEKIARKFNLDPVKDEKLIKQIKHDQTIWTLPGAFLPFVGALIAFLIVNNQNSKNIEVE